MKSMDIRKVGSIITGTAAYASTAGLSEELRLLSSLVVTLIGWCLAVSGFSLDFCADREMDKIAPRSTIRSNPIATGQIPVKTGFIFSMIFLFLSFSLSVLFSWIRYINWWIFIPWRSLISRWLFFSYPCYTRLRRLSGGPRRSFHVKPFCLPLASYPIC